jgi:hypothetical protein
MIICLSTYKYQLAPYSETDQSTMKLIASYGTHLILKSGEKYKFKQGDIFV